MRFAWLAALALCSALGPAAPAAAQDYAHPGTYVAANGVIGLAGNGHDAGVGGAFRVGHRYGEAFSLEGQLEFSGKMEPHLHEGTLTLNARWAFSPARLQPYALLGAGIGTAFDHVDSEESWDVSGVLRAGAGVEYYLTPHVGFSAEAAYNVLTGGATDYAALGWGVFYRW